MFAPAWKPAENVPLGARTVKAAPKGVVWNCISRRKKRMNNTMNARRCLLFVLVLGLLLAAPVSSSATPVVSLSGSLPSPQPVGTLVTWTANATDTDSGTLMYAFNVGPQGGILA